MELIVNILNMLICIINFCVTGTMIQGIIAVDEKKKWAYFIGSSPKTARGQIGSKYLFALLSTAAVLAYCIVLSHINSIVYGINISYVKVILCSMAIIQIFLHSFEFPFLIRFGCKIGNYYRITIVYILLFAILIYFLFGKTVNLDEFVDLIAKIASDIKLKKVYRMCKVVIPIAVGLIFYLSYRISCRSYLKGTENYDA